MPIFFYQPIEIGYQYRWNIKIFSWYTQYRTNDELSHSAEEVKWIYWKDTNDNAEEDTHFIE